MVYVQSLEYFISINVVGYILCPMKYCVIGETSNRYVEAVDKVDNNPIGGQLPHWLGFMMTSSNGNIE